MTRTEKRHFIRELSRNIVAEALAKVPNMPEEWDGIELRQYLADRFSAEAWHDLQDKRNKRRRNYDMACLERNL